MAAGAEPERMAELKKAYADVMVSTATESAARILRSERKAMQLQQSLSKVKEEALATLLRVKSVMDSKLKEAEKASSNQLRRIQELECQLNKAGHAIVSLREELERANNELMKAKNGLVDPSNEQHTISGNLTTVNDISIIQKNKDDDSLKDLNAKKDCGRNPTDISSIFVRSKEPELYSKGFTQRIRAFEHNILSVEVPHEQRVDGQVQDLMNESNGTENESTERLKTVKVLTKEAKIPTAEGKDVQKSSRSYSGLALNFFKKVPQRKPRTKFMQTKIIYNEGFNKNSGVNLFTKSISEEPSHKMLRSHVEDRTFSNISYGLLKCNNENVTEQIDMKQSQLNRQNENRQDLKDQSDSAEDVINGVLLTMQNVELNTEENLVVSDMKQDLPKAGKEKLFKYTFQRKRKRGSSGIKNEGFLAEKMTSKRDSEDTQDVLLEQPKPPLVAELPPDDRWLMQVAHQLISLSEKR